MKEQEIYDILLKQMPMLEIKQNEPMAIHTTFRVGGKADIYIKINNIEELKFIQNFVKINNIDLTILGNGSNVLVKDNGIRGITIVLAGLNKIEIEENEDDKIICNVGAGVKLGMLSGVLQKKGITGFEFASGIPGTIGGAIRMNAGAYGSEIKDIIKEVTYLDEEGNIKTIPNEQLDFSYRHSRFKEEKKIIIEAKLKLEKGNSQEIKKKIEELRIKREEKQPVDMPSAGSTFKRGNNFISAALIDEAGLKGYAIGGAQVSKKHAGFIVNTGNATATDIQNLIDYIIKVVYEKFGKVLELEIEIIGE